MSGNITREVVSSFNGIICLLYVLLGMVLHLHIYENVSMSHNNHLVQTICLTIILSYNKLCHIILHNIIPVNI